MIKIDVTKLSYTKESTLDEDVNFDPETYKCYPPLLEVKKCHVQIKVRRYEQFIYMILNIKADVVLQCSYTLKPFDSKIKTNEELHFANRVEEGDDDLIEFRGNYIELDKYIFDSLSASIPPSPKAPGASLPKGGKDYRVISSDDYLKEKEEKIDPRFAALDDLEFDD